MGLSVHLVSVRPSAIAWLKMSASGAHTMSAEYFHSSPATLSGQLARLLLRRWRASLTSRSVMGFESGPLGMSSIDRAWAVG